MIPKFGGCRKNNEGIADILGRINEMFSLGSSDSDLNEENMDLFNNAVGRKIGLKIRSRKKLLKAIHEALKNNQLIIDLIDGRKHVGPGLIKGTPGYVVVKLQESDSGRNVLFYDRLKNMIMTKHQFVTLIKRGDYPAYVLKKLHGELTAVSVKDGIAVNNLG